jgi:hypothetical protein
VILNSLYLSNNGLYLLNDEKIFFAVEEKSYSLEEIELPKWVEILRENSEFSLKHELIDINELFSFNRKVTYQILERFSFDNKSKLMLEYESKFGKMLLTENTELTEGLLGKAWNWAKEQAVEVGGFWGKTGQDFLQCVTTNPFKSADSCNPFFEDYRDMLFSPTGIAIETFLSVIGLAPVPMVAWGIMLLWDISLMMSGSPEFSWLNLFFDFLGVGFGALAKIAKGVFKTAGILGKSNGKSLAEVLQMAMKNPEAAQIIKKTETGLKSVGPSIISGLKSTGDFLSKKLGMKWVSKALDGVSEAMAKVLEAIGIVSRKEGVTTAQGVKSGLKMGGLAKGIYTGLETEPVQKGIGAIGTGMRKVFGLGQSDNEFLKALQNSGEAKYVEGIDF